MSNYLIRKYCIPYSSSLENETDLEVLADKLSGIAQIAEDADKRLFTVDDINNICTVIQAQMTRYEERLGELKKAIFFLELYNYCLFLETQR